MSIDNRPSYFLLLVSLVVWTLGLSCSPSSAPPEDSSADLLAGLGKALTFHAGFDDGWDAAFALGDRRLYTAPNYDQLERATPGLGTFDAEIVYDSGRFQHALQFTKKNTLAVFYYGEQNVAFAESGWNGTVSFWLSLDPATDLEPGFSDPIQITDAAYNDACVWVDFSDADPRQFRLGVFGDLAAWNPENLPPAENQKFQDRLVAVDKPPFARGRWTHVVITHEGLGSAAGGSAKLYLDGQLQGAANGITEPFIWDLSRATIRVGVNFVGLVDDIALFSRSLTEQEIQALHALDRGVASLPR